MTFIPPTRKSALMCLVLLVYFFGLSLQYMYLATSEPYTDNPRGRERRIARANKAARRTGMPPDLTFQTKPPLALALLARSVAQDDVPARWLAADALYGDSPAFRDGVAALGLCFFTAVACTTLIWRRHPALIIPVWSGKVRKPTKKRLKTPSNAPYQVDELIHRLPKTAWHRVTIKEGAKGPIVCDLAVVRVTEECVGLPGARLWLVIRRSLSDPSDVRYYVSNAPATIDMAILAGMLGVR